MIAVDTTALSLLFVPGSVSHNSKTKAPIEYGPERMNFLAERLYQAGDGIIIPTPVLSEIIVKLTLEQSNSLLATLNASSWFRVESFDSIAAIELGLRTAKAIAEGDKREGSRADWTKVKFDRQIVAIAIVNGASAIISDDPHVEALCDRWGFKVQSL